MDQVVTKTLKTFELKGSVEENCFTGDANGLGIMDRGGDVIAPGAFSPAIPGFLKNGFIAVGHAWNGLPVAMPTAGKEEGGFLKISAAFHSTDEAQAARTVVKERLDAGKAVGLSVGFLPDREKCAWFESGEALYKFCEENKITDGLDAKSIRAWKDYCRLISGVKELFEVSIVTVPMNQKSRVTAAKSADAEGEGLPAGLTLSEHLDAALAAVEEVTSRLLSYKGMRDADNRPVSKDRLTQAEALHKTLGEFLAAGAEPETNETTTKLAQLNARLRMLRADALRDA